MASHAAELRENLDIILNALLYQPDKVLWCVAARALLQLGPLPSSAQAETTQRWAVQG